MLKVDMEKIAAYFRNAASLVYKEELTNDELFFLWKNLLFLSKESRDLCDKIEKFLPPETIKSNFAKGPGYWKD